MKRFLEELKGARKIEWFLALLAIASLLLTQADGIFSIQPHLTEQEIRLKSILSRIDGAGRVEVMIADRDECSVLVVSEGAHDAFVCLQLQYAIQTLLGTEASRIEIVPYQK